MMGAGFDFSSMVDLGFVLLVTAVCIRSLTSTSLDGEKVASRWRRELLELERVLRELISEAGSASANLDRTLLKRKGELETLLKRLDQTENGVSKAKAPAPPTVKSAAAKPAPAAAAPRPKPKSPSPAPRDEDWEMGILDELPNETWEVAPEKFAEQETEPEEDLGHLAELVESASDTLRISSQISQEAARTRTNHPRSTAPKAPAGGLSGQIEKIKMKPVEPAEPPVEDDGIFRQLSIMDPTAYKIARRLLAAGTEIHVVARKLDLPVSEIRLMDRLMREEGETQVRDGEVGPNYKPTETVPRKKIVRDRLAAAAERRKEAEQRAERRPDPDFVELTEETIPQAMSEEAIDRLIERELALL